MTTDKELADAIGVVFDSCRGVISREMLSKAKAELDPPKPTYPDGTIAWVTAHGGNRYYCAAFTGDDKFGGGWYRIGQNHGGRVCLFDQAEKVEPLRVLGDDEIAIPRHFRADIVKCLQQHTNCSLAELALEEVLSSLDAEQVQP